VKTFQFQLVITEKCNLNCSYCYMNKRPKEMTKEVFHKHYEILPNLMKLHGADNYVAAYFGGEPLINWELIEYSVPIFMRDEKCSSIFIATNGLALGPERQEFLRKNNVSLSISFDGLWNDINRPLKNGLPSVETYLNLKSILNMRNCKVMVGPIRNNITMVENYKWFRDVFGIKSPDFTIIRDDIWSDKDVEIFKTELKDLTDENIKLIKEGNETLIGWYGLYFLDTYYGRKFGKRKHGCFAGNSGLGFMPDGKIYPCARFGSENFHILYDTIKEIEYKKSINLFFNPKIFDPSTYEKCNTCKLKVICNAGCTFSQLQNGLKVEKEECVPIDNVCKLLKLLYSETGRLIEEVQNTNTFKKIVRNLLRS